MIGALIVRRHIPRVYDALNRHDLEASFQDFSEEVVFVYPRTASGTYTGKAVHVQDFFSDTGEQSHAAWGEAGSKDSLQQPSS